VGAWKDFETVKGILARKHHVANLLFETAEWCQPGRWYVEGPYARHKGEPVPDTLRDSVRGIRSRRLSRELVERGAHPWFVDLPASRSAAPTAGSCSIAYLSNGGDWKLFDLVHQEVWSRPRFPEKLRREIANRSKFTPYFNVPPFAVEDIEGQAWRHETYFDGPTLARSNAATRTHVVQTLIAQYAAFALVERIPPDAQARRAAIDAFIAFAPDSLPARIVMSQPDDVDDINHRLARLPAHDDLSGQNIFVVHNDPWIIDWDVAGSLRPALHDLLYLVLREAELGRLDLFQQYINGDFDAPLAHIFLPSDRSASKRHNLVAMAHSYILRFQGLREAQRTEANRRNIDVIWKPLQGYFAGLI
jgi:hypothetical protein